MTEEYERFGPEWVKEIMKHDKPFIVEMLQRKAKMIQHYENTAEAAEKEVAVLTTKLDALEEINDSSIQREASFEVMDERDRAFRNLKHLKEWCEDSLKADELPSWFDKLMSPPEPRESVLVSELKQLQSIITSDKRFNIRDDFTVYNLMASVVKLSQQ